MTGLEHRGLVRPTPPGIAQLLEDYRRQQEVLRRQTDEMARLLERVLAAADREASEIIIAARKEIGRVVGKARQDLLELIVQVETLREAELGASERRLATDVAVEHVREHVVARRQALRGLVEAARRDLETLTQAPPSSPEPTAEPFAAPVPTPEIAPDLPAAQSESPLTRRLPSIFAVVAASTVAIGALLFAVGWMLIRGEASNRTAATVTIATALTPPSQRSNQPRPTRTTASTVRPQERVLPAATVAVPAAASTNRGNGQQTPSRAATGVAERTPGAVAPRIVATAGTQTGDRPDLTARAQRWLDAYYRQDASSLAALSLPQPTISDDRNPDERVPSGLAVTRMLEGLTIQVVGEQAVLSGKMIERADANGQPLQRVSWVSQMWTRTGGQWSLMDARIRAEDRLK